MDEFQPFMLETEAWKFIEFSTPKGWYDYRPFAIKT